MRLGVVIAVLGLSALLVVGLRYIVPAKPPPGTESLAIDLPQALREGSGPTQIPEKPPALPPAGPRATTSAPSGGDADPAEQDDAQEALLAARLEQWRLLVVRTDDASLETLVSELMNPDREVRAAVLDLITQSGNRAAIPKLEALAARLEDPAAQREVLDAVDFLKLPTLTELLNQPSGATHSEAR